jgi:hypothetical protein
MGCTPCAAGHYQAEAGAVLAGTERACAQCPAGTEAEPGASACTPCEAGKFKEADMVGCEACASATAYAASATSGGSCTECSRGCGAGERWDPCPGRGGEWFACAACSPPLRGAQEYVTGADNRACWWQCRRGFYESEGDCLACTTADCPPGSVFIPCTAYADRDCSTACANATMPSENAVWTTGCEWGCAAGFVLQARVVVAWTEYACVRGSAG